MIGLEKGDISKIAKRCKVSVSMVWQVSEGIKTSKKIKAALLEKQRENYEKLRKEVEHNAVTDFETQK